MNALHQPVLLKEVLEIFDPRPGQTYIDATVDGGGHAAAIVERITPGGTLLGIDWDCDLIRALKIKNQKLNIKNIELICENYANIRTIAAKHNARDVNGILFDLGFSSFHIEKSGRGFTFAKDEPLDMRYSPDKNGLTAAEIVNRWPEEAISDLLRKFGEERFARRIARAIVRARARKGIVSTRALTEIIFKGVPSIYRRGRLHPATRTFQALRLAVNRELESLERVLPDAASLLAPGGKMAIISFHSLEDRVVKTFMRIESRKGAMRILTPKPLRAAREEITMNPRSRSARLRAMIKL